MVTKKELLAKDYDAIDRAIAGVNKAVAGLNKVDADLLKAVTEPDDPARVD